MRILFVALALPLPPTNGHRLRNSMLLRAMAAEGHEMSLLSFAEPHELAGDHVSLGSLLRDVRLVPLPPAASAGRIAYALRARALVSPLPYGVHRFESQPMKQAVRQALLLGDFDCVICDDIYNIRNVGDTGRLPCLLNKHDVTHVILERFLAHERHLLKRAYGWLEYQKLRRWEGATLSRAVGVLACSEEDRRVLSRLTPDARIAIVPNVVDVDPYIPAPEAEDSAPTLLYVGAMDWYPNLDAVNFFVEHILPEVGRQIPGVRFRVAGRSPAERFRQRFSQVKRIEFTGSVPDIRAEIAAATVCVVPLRIGSGTRIKILEAGAMEKAIVSTRIGAEGLDFVDGEDIVLADEPMAFASAIVSLLADPARRRKLGEAARRRVERQYSLPALRAAVRTALTAFIAA